MWAMGDTYKCFDSWSTFGCTIWIVGLLYSLFLFPLLIDRIQCWSAHVWIHGIYGIYVCSIERRIKRLFQSTHRLGFGYFSSVNNGLHPILLLMMLEMQSKLFRNVVFMQYIILGTWIFSRTQPVLLTRVLREKNWSPIDKSTHIFGSRFYPK